MVMDVMGAGGKTYSTFWSDGRREGRTCCSDDHPAGVSPSPCKKIRAADGHVDDAEEEVVDIARDAIRWIIKVLQ